MNSLGNLPLDNMNQRHYALETSIAKYYLKAARVCLDRHHSSPKTFILDKDDQKYTANLEWSKANKRTRTGFANRDEATRDGAYICAIAAVELLYDMFAVSRAENLTGADYYLSNSADDLEASFRLEVSGIDEGNNSDIKYRLGEKIEQTRNGKSSLPAIAAVVGFKSSLIMTKVVDDDVLD